MIAEVRVYHLCDHLVFSILLENEPNLPLCQVKLFGDDSLSSQIGDDDWL